MRATLNDAGLPQAVASYDAWGVPETSMIAPFGYTGELQRGSDVWLRARWYGAARGSFGSRDPYAGSSETPYSVQYYPYGYSNPTRWVDPSGRAVRDPGREPTVCPPGMFAACYEDFDRQHGNNRFLHPSENANFAFFDAYHDAALAYQSPDGHLPYELALWRSQYHHDRSRTVVSLTQSAAAECGPAAGMAGMAEGANELNKNLAGANRGVTSLGIQPPGNNLTEQDEPDAQLPSKIQRLKNWWLSGPLVKVYDGVPVKGHAWGATIDFHANGINQIGLYDEQGLVFAHIDQPDTTTRAWHYHEFPSGQPDLGHGTKYPHIIIDDLDGFLTEMGFPHDWGTPP